MNKMDYKALGLQDSLIEAIKKCHCKENDAYNPSGAGPANLPAEPCGSKADAMPSASVNIAYESKKKKVKKEDTEGVFGTISTGGPATYHKDNPV